MVSNCTFLTHKDGIPCVFTNTSLPHTIKGGKGGEEPQGPECDCRLEGAQINTDSYLRSSWLHAPPTMLGYTCPSPFYSRIFQV